MGRGVPPKAVLTIRLLIGLYLLYTDYQIYPDVMAREGTSKIVMIGIMVFFAVAGIILILMSGKELIAGRAGTDGQEAGTDLVEEAPGAETGTGSSKDTAGEGSVKDIEKAGSSEDDPEQKKE